MKLHNRKLLKLFDAAPGSTLLPPPSPLPPHQPAVSTPGPSPPSKIPIIIPTPTPQFDSSMTLTVLVLLIVLFFMGFFSIYIRRFTDDDPTVAISRRRRHQDVPRDQQSSSSPSDHRNTSSISRKGLDPDIVRSLPVYCYYRGNARYQMDCAVCLSEFEEEEKVKMIPRCKHLFHVECINTWLRSHVSCPVCRVTQLFEVTDDDGLGVMKERFDQGASSGEHGGSTVENGDTYIEVREVGTTICMRRISSCSSLGERASSLQRTSSF